MVLFDETVADLANNEDIPKHSNGVDKANYGAMIV